MKKFMTIFVSALLGFAANAQMMPDSTVQFVAYWNVGDKYQYNFESIDKEVDANGDTTIVKQSYEVIEFEVVAKTDESYQIKMTTLEEENSDPQGKLIDKIFILTGSAAQLFPDIGHIDLQLFHAALRYYQHYRREEN